MGKNIVICCDGTWDDADHHQTNVALMQEAIALTAKDGADQLIYYISGVGTKVGWWQRLWQGTTGKTIDEKIMEGYKQICQVYRPGDKIFLFGFSRGAYTARSLAGFIHNSGLLDSPITDGRVQAAYALYRDRSPATKPDAEKSKSFRANEAKEQNTKIHFLGVWDTVGALGVPLRLWQLGGKKYQFHDCSLGPHITHAYHAMAIDERRSIFDVTKWVLPKGGLAPGQVLEQRWFAGVHRNVGGAASSRALSDYALHWMMEKAMQAGLQMNPDDVQQHPWQYNFNVALDESLKGIYSLSKPIWRKIEESQYETIDNSVFERFEQYQPEYRPPNLPDLRRQGVHKVVGHQFSNASPA